MSEAVSRAHGEMSDREGLFHVRQYRPGYFTGFTNSVLRDVPWGAVLSAPWLENFKSAKGFLHFSIEESQGSDEMFLMANYTGARAPRWVAGFVLPASSQQRAPDGGLLRDNWRYKEHET